MNYSKNSVRRLSLGTLASATWLTLSGTAHAAEGGGSTSYVFPYFLVVVLVGIGMAIVCSPSRRREKAKPEDYTEKKLV